MLVFLTVTLPWKPPGQLPTMLYATVHQELVPPEDGEVEGDGEVDDEVDDGDGAVVAISVMRPSAIAAPPTIACASLVSVASRTEGTTPVFFAPSSSV